MILVLNTLFRALTLSVLSLVIYPWAAMAGSLAVGDDQFCAEAQVRLVQARIPVTNVVHGDFESFVESKSTSLPLATQQFMSHPLAGSDHLSTVVSCKMKTAGSIIDAHPAAGGESPVAGEDRSCDFLTREVLGAVTDTLAPEDRVFDGKIVVDDEEMTFMGPMWLNPWPFQSAYRDSDGIVHLRSRALYVPWSIFIPAPAAFKGVYYCHMAAPEYVETLLRGESEAPPLGEDQ